jgi:hypothetical protein
MIVRPPTRNNGFGNAVVKAPMRRPRPAARIIAVSGISTELATQQEKESSDPV